MPRNHGSVSLDPLSAVPAALVAGDDLDLLLSFADYPASDGWTVTLGLAGGVASKLTATSTASGDDHAIVVSATDSLLLEAGWYTYTLRATDGTSVRTIQSGKLEVLASVIDADAGTLDSAAKWDAIIAACDSAMLDLMTGGMKLYMIAGRQVQFNSAAEIQRTRAWAMQQKAAFRGPPAPIQVGRFATASEVWT